eukprot:356378-Chlamydomonas_euryale.AAC.5
MPRQPRVGKHATTTARRDGGRCASVEACEGSCVRVWRRASGEACDGGCVAETQALAGAVIRNATLFVPPSPPPLSTPDPKP